MARAPRPFRRIAFVAAAVAWFASAQLPAVAYDFLSGHCDIGLGYLSGTGPGSGPRIFMQFGANAVATGLTSDQLLAGQPGGIPGEWSTSSFVTRVPESVAVACPASQEWDFIGAPAGDLVWVLGQSSQPGVPFIGFDTERAAGGTGTFTLSAVRLRPQGGEVSLFSMGAFGIPTVLWSSFDPAADAFTVPAQTHAHYSFGFTKPGVYELDITGSGSGFAGSATGVLAFEVVPEPHGGPAIAGAAAVGCIVARGWPRRPRAGACHCS